MSKESDQGRKLNHYARLYGDGKITLARAAREAGVSLWEMMDYARSKKIPAQYDLEDFKKDLKDTLSRRVALMALRTQNAFLENSVRLFHDR